MAEPADDDVTAWALAAGRGDPDALVAFVRATQRDVHRFLLHLGGAADVEDLRQETYLRALGALPRFAGASSARTWLLAIARRVAADSVRQARRRPRTAAPPDQDGVEVAAAASPGAESTVVLRMLVADLDPDRRAAFVLTQVLDLSYAEAALVCGCPVGTIRSRVARAREDLVDALAARSRPDGRGAFRDRA